MASTKPLTGRSVLLILAGFFAVMLAANAAMVVTAFSSWTGLATNRAYERGRAYNKTIDAQRTQAALGWQGVVAREGDVVRLTLADANGVPVEGAAVRALLVRPVESGRDVELDLAAEGGGRYAASATLAPGQWEVRIEAMSNGSVWRTRARLIVERAP